MVTEKTDLSRSSRRMSGWIISTMKLILTRLAALWNTVTYKFLNIQKNSRNWWGWFSKTRSPSKLSVKILKEIFETDKFDCFSFQIISIVYSFSHESNNFVTSSMMKKKFEIEKKLFGLKCILLCSVLLCFPQKSNQFFIDR